jgi:hypothetical protein
MSSSEESLSRAEALLTRLEAARAQLEATDDPQQAIGVLQELSELAKEIESELQKARSAAATDAADA